MENQRAPAAETHPTYRGNVLEGVITEGSRGIVSAATASETSQGCIQQVPKNKVTFLAQIVVVYGIISVSIYHLSVQSPNQELWLILLASAVGYILPRPGLKYLKPAQLQALGGSPLISTTTSDEIDAKGRQGSETDN